jgi:hypothetical protein
MRLFNSNQYRDTSPSITRPGFALTEFFVLPVEVNLSRCLMMPESGLIESFLFEITMAALRGLKSAMVSVTRFGLDDGRR